MKINKFNFWKVLLQLLAQLDTGMHTKKKKLFYRPKQISWEGDRGGRWQKIFHSLKMAGGKRSSFWFFHSLRPNTHNDWVGPLTYVWKLYTYTKENKKKWVLYITVIFHHWLFTTVCFENQIVYICLAFYFCRIKVVSLSSSLQDIFPEYYHKRIYYNMYSCWTLV